MTNINHSKSPQVLSPHIMSTDKPGGFASRLCGVTRTLSEEFYTRSPNTQMHIKDMTGGVTPTSYSSKKRMTGVDEQPHEETNEERFKNASDYEKEMMFRHNLISPNCIAYREYTQKHAKTT